MATATTHIIDAEAKHTPGPWSVEKPDQFQGHKFIPVEVPGKIICEVYGSDDDFLKVTAVDHANARLCAAAPELLEALKQMDVALCDGFETRKQRMAMRHALIAARAAVAKATGAHK